MFGLSLRSIRNVRLFITQKKKNTCQLNVEFITHVIFNVSSNICNGYQKITVFKNNVGFS